MTRVKSITCCVLRASGAFLSPSLLTGNPALWRSLLLTLPLVILSACGRVPAPDAKTDISNLLSQGDGKFKASDFQGAMQLFNQARSMAPEDVRVYYRISKTAVELKDKKSGLDAVTKLRSLKPELAEDSELRQIETFLHALPKQAVSDNNVLALKADLEQRQAAKPVAAESKSAAAPASPAVVKQPTPELTGSARIKYDALVLILKDADTARDGSARRQAMREALEKSGELLREHPELVKVWGVRAEAAMELGQHTLAREAAQKLLALKAEDSTDSALRQTLAKLERNHLLGPARVNSLGMTFVLVPGSAALFSIWETRVQDYEAFAQATSRKWEHESDLPGMNLKITQGPKHPAVYIRWKDAKAFCAWLTNKERAEGRLKPSEQYRLPTDAEWSKAVGLENESGGTPGDKSDKVTGAYPWGEDWPPPEGAGNFADVAYAAVHPEYTSMEDYKDGYAETAPVGSFTASPLGLYDMAGNAWEWCEDQCDSRLGDQRILRGGSWNTGDPGQLRSSDRHNGMPDWRLADVGFRVVLALGASSP